MASRKDRVVLISDEASSSSNMHALFPRHHPALLCQHLGVLQLNSCGPCLSGGSSRPHRLKAQPYKTLPRLQLSFASPDCHLRSDPLANRSEVLMTLGSINFLSGHGTQRNMLPSRSQPYCKR